MIFGDISNAVSQVVILGCAANYQKVFALRAKYGPSIFGTNSFGMVIVDGSIQSGQHLNFKAFFLCIMDES